MEAIGSALLPKITRFDAILSQGRPFGDSSYIQEQMQRAFKNRIEELGTSLLVARELSAVLNQADARGAYRVLGDPIVRGAVQQALWQILTGTHMALPLERCEDVLRETILHLRTRAALGSSPLESGEIKAPRLGPTSYMPWIWGGDRSDVFGRAFEQIVEHEYGERLCTPSAEDIKLLQKSTRLLEELLPLLSRSALSHTRLVGVFPGTGNWQTVASSSQFRLTGVIFLNKATFKNPWWLAEHLLHESLHQKLYDFRHAHSLLARDDPNEANHPGDLRTIVSLWNTPGLSGSNVWDPHRAIAAFHVYVHLALFCTLAEQRAAGVEGVYGRIDDARPTMTASRRAFERARYLGENLRSSCWPELGLAGQRMVEWLSSILDALDPSPPPPGSYLHLLLDRYLNEAAKVERQALPRGVTAQLAEFVEDEVTFTRALLAAIGSQCEATEFSRKYSKLEADAAFAQVRRLIAETLSRLAPDGYSIEPLSFGIAGKSADEMVSEMVERSSHKLAAIGAIKAGPYRSSPARPGSGSRF
jgi:hypothetical protein